ncbi:MAG: basic amino acid ABC transporter substrate-binding protein [bacterium]|nr:basic amino acid ABC transporter substrate-binding protein [bacterium]
MKNVKKFAALGLAAMMAASMMGCGGSSSSTTTAAPETTAQQTEASTAETTAKSEETTTAAEAQTEASAGGVLTMATNAEFDPWEYHEGDKIVGIDAEVAEEIAKKLGMELKIEDMSFDAVIPSVATGKADIGMAAISVNEERKASVDFTNTYADSALVILVQASNEEIASSEDLAGKKVGVQLGTTGDVTATDIVGEESMERYPSYFEAVQSLKQGKIDAIVIDKAPAKVFLSQNEDIKQVGEEMSSEQYAIAVAKGNTELVEKLNKAIEELQADGTFDAIINKYIPAE